MNERMRELLNGRTMRVYGYSDTSGERFISLGYKTTLIALIADAVGGCCSKHWVAGRISETGNEHEVKLAKAHPGHIIVIDDDPRKAPKDQKVLRLIPKPEKAKAP